MKKNFKRIVSVILCLVILCCPFANVMKPAHANPGVVWAAGASVLEFMAFVLGMVGITFASKGDMTEASNQYLSSNPAISSKLTELLDTAKSQVNGTYKLKMGAVLFLYMKNTVIPSVQEFFGRANTSVVVPDNSYYTFDQLKVLDIPMNSLVSCAQLSNGYPSTQSITFKNNGVDVTMKVVPLNAYSWCSYVNNIATQDISFPISDPSKYNVFVQWAIRYYVQGDVTYLTNCLAGYAVNKTDGSIILADCRVGNNYGVAITNQLLPGTATLPYDYDIDYSNSEFMNALNKIYEQLLALGATLTLPWDRPVEDVEEGKKEAEDEKAKPVPWDPNWALWWEQLGIKELIETVTQSKTVTESDVKMPELPVSIKDKFPFCVPFDVYYMIEKLNAPSAAPSWNIPFKIQSLGINQTIPLDLSGWESVAAVCRWANVLLFILALVLLTRNIIRA